MCLWCDLTDSGRKNPVLWASLFLLCALWPVSLALMRSCMQTIDRYTLRPRISLLHTDHYRLSPLECCSWVVRPPWQRDSIFDDSHGVTVVKWPKVTVWKLLGNCFCAKILNCDYMDYESPCSATLQDLSPYPSSLTLISLLDPMPNVYSLWDKSIFYKIHLYK